MGETNVCAVLRFPPTCVAHSHSVPPRPDLSTLLVLCVVSLCGNACVADLPEHMHNLRVTTLAEVNHFVIKQYKAFVTSEIGRPGH